MSFRYHFSKVRLLKHNAGWPLWLQLLWQEDKLRVQVVRKEAWTCDRQVTSRPHPGGHRGSWQLPLSTSSLSCPFWLFPLCSLALPSHLPSSFTCSAFSLACGSQVPLEISQTSNQHLTWTSNDLVGLVEYWIFQEKTRAQEPVSWRWWFRGQWSGSVLHLPWPGGEPGVEHSPDMWRQIYK